MLFGKCLHYASNHIGQAQERPQDTLCFKCSVRIYYKTCYQIISTATHSFGECNPIVGKRFLSRKGADEAQMRFPLRRKETKPLWLLQVTTSQVFQVGPWATQYPETNILPSSP